MTEDELNAENTAVALVGKETPFTILEGKELEPYLATLKAEEGHRTRSAHLFLSAIPGVSGDVSGAASTSMCL